MLFTLLNNIFPLPTGYLSIIFWNIRELPRKVILIPIFPDTQFFRNPLPDSPAYCTCEEVSEHRVWGAEQTFAATLALCRKRSGT